MKLLGIETSGTVAGVAIMQENTLLAELQITNTLTHSETIMPMIEQLLHNVSWTIADIDQFAVNIGPGSFTGVRIGTCIANALASAYDKPVIGIPSLHVLYAGVMVYPGRVCSLIDAKNGNAYAAQYEQGICIESPAPVVIDEYLQKLPKDVLFVGDAARIHREVILETVSNATFAPDHLNTCRAGAMCYFASLTHENDAKEAVPLYLRPSQAERMFAMRHQEA